MKIHRAWIGGWGHLTHASENRGETETSFCGIQVGHYNIADTAGTARISCSACRAGAGDNGASMSTFRDGEVTHLMQREIYVCVTDGGVGIERQSARILCDPLIGGFEIRDDGPASCLACLGAL